MGDVLPNDLDCLLEIPKENLWINLYPNALGNVKRALMTNLDQKIGKYCNKNNAILLGYDNLKFRAKHFQVHEDYPICRFPVSISATYYKPEAGVFATGTITRVDHISVTCLVHDMIHVTISLRQSVNFDCWCAVGQQIIFVIKGGEMHYKGVRLLAIVTQECVDKMEFAFGDQTLPRSRKLSSSSDSSTVPTPVKKKEKALKRRLSDIISESSKRFRANETFTDEESIDFGEPPLTSTQIKGSKSSLPNFDEDSCDSTVLAKPKVKVEVPSRDSTPVPKRKSKKSRG